MDLVPITIFGCITGVIIFITSRRHRERIELIKRGKAPQSFKVQSPKRKGSMALLIGLLSCAIGLALLVSAIFLQDFDRDMITGAFLCLFGGGALLGYWRLTKEDRDYARRVHEQQIAKYLESTQADAKEQETPENTDDSESVAQG
jgi:hypothetical protein